MPSNGLDQAPRTKFNGDKFSKILNQNRKAWGKAIRPHELESIFFRLIDSKNSVQLKLMLFLTGNAEGYKLVKDATIERLGVSITPYYKARDALKERGWISVKNEGDVSYIIINYDKIYEEGKKVLSIKEEGISEDTSVEEGNSQNTSEEGNFEKTPVLQSISENTSVEQSISEDNPVECISQNNSQKEGISENNSESTLQSTSEGNSDNYYNNIIEYNKENNIRAKTQEELKAEFDAAWKNGGTNGGNSHLTGAAAMF